jgi:predicted DNA-binding transcriptional regulator AlpA
MLNDERPAPRKLAKTDRYLTVDQLQVEWGISHEAIRRFREDAADPIPFLRAGRRYIFVRAEVEEWARRRAKHQTRQLHRKSRSPPTGG